MRMGDYSTVNAGGKSIIKEDEKLPELQMGKYNKGRRVTISSESGEIL
jgi:hypothetical protein